MVKFKATATRLGAALPGTLWPNIYNSCAKIHNRSPRAKNNWEAPIETLHRWLRDNNRDVPIGDDLAGINFLTYGCKAYELTRQVKKDQQKSERALDARAHIGYLVGYIASNLYEIWIPELNQVVATRDVTFDEDCLYDSHKPRRLDDIPVIEHIEDTIEVRGPLPDSDKSDIESESESDESEDEGTGPTESAGPTEDTGPTEPEDNQSEISDTQSDIYPTPKSTPEPNSLAESNEPDQPDPSKQRRQRKEYGNPTKKSDRIASKPPVSYKAAYAAFATGTAHRIHHRDLPPEPRNYQNLKGHQFEQQFLAAMDTEWHAVIKKGTFEWVLRNTVAQQVIPLTWIYRYKFDKHGYLIKLKARICVRGDLQEHSEKDTYAATLAGRSFRSLMAIAARWDLEMRRYDAVNAFTNSDLDEVIYVEFPDGFKRRGWIIRLKKALYGLRRSPLLWHNDLSTTFINLGLTQGTEETCVFTNEWVTVFVYVDDIVFLYRTEDEPRRIQLQQQLFKKYEMHELGPLRWFLGIRILRDRAQKKVWLCQDSYIEKITNTFNLATEKPPRTPYPNIDLPPNPGQATDSFVHQYQRKVGSIIYPAVISRPDIAFAASRLSRFMQNPSPAHMAAVDQTIQYLWNTRFLAIQFDGHIDEAKQFILASDASFADNMPDRKSTQGFIMMLFGGPIAWRSGKQSIVTGSTTEAELLSFVNTTKEGMQAFRVFRDMQLDLDMKLKVYCDNTQSLRMITSSNAATRTALKHIDVQHLWIRQEYQHGFVEAEYMPTNEMPADGLTKALPRQKLETFIGQLGLVDVKVVIDSQKEDSDSDSD